MKYVHHCEADTALSDLPEASLVYRMLYLSGELVLDDNKDFLFISDLDTHEILLIDGTLPPVLTRPPASYVGRKCYEVFHCTHEQLGHCTIKDLGCERYQIERRYSSYLNRRYIYEYKQISWAGKPARLQICRDITDSSRAEQLLHTLLEDNDVLTMCVLEIVSKNSGIERSLTNVLKHISGFFNSDQASFYFFDGFDDNISNVISYGEDSGLIDAFISTSRGSAAISEMKHQLYLDASSDLSGFDASFRETIIKNNVASFCLTPIIFGERIVGLMAVVNAKSHIGGLPLLRTLCAYISTAINSVLLRRKNERILYFDDLVGCDNFISFKKKADKLLAENTEKKYAVMSYDIKKFRYINDVFGFQTGDALLKYFSQCLSSSNEVGETFGHITADKFIVLRMYRHPEELMIRFNEDAHFISSFPELRDSGFKISVSAGAYIASSVSERLSLNEMIDRSNIARRNARATAGNQLVWYNERMRELELKFLRLESQLDAAIEGGSIVAHYQPQINMKVKGGAIHAEALVRWKKGDGTLLMPADFIDLFERDGKIVSVDICVFETVCRFLNKLRNIGVTNVIISVNVSRVSVFQPNFVERYCAIKDKYDIPDGMIELELTESMAVNDFERFCKVASEIHCHGFLCSMDDFGSGYSSLNVLMNLPFDVLKLDRQFFLPCEFPQRREKVVSSILSLASSLNMRVVAEGIESHEQAEFLVRHGCDYAQSYLFERPMDQESFESWIGIPQ